MRLFPIILAFLTLPGQGPAQGKQMTAQNNSTYSKDTTLVNALVLQARSLRHQNNDSCLFLYRQAIGKSRQIAYAEGLALSLTGLGLTYMDLGDYKKSFSLYKEAKPFCEMLSHATGKPLVTLYNNLAALYGNRGIFDSAFYYYYKALNTYENKQVKDTSLLLLIYTNLGGRLAADKQFSQAEFYLSKAVSFARKTNNSKMLARVYIDLGVLAGAQQKYRESRQFSVQALEILKGGRDPRSKIAAHCNIAKAFLEENNIKDALNHYQNALKINNNGSGALLVAPFKGIGACYAALKNYPEAQHFYLLALKISRKEKLDKNVYEIYKALGEIHSELEDYKKALYYFESYTKLKDSIINAEKIAATQQLEVRYRSSQKEKELAEKELLLALQEGKIKTQKSWIYSFAAISVLLSGLLGSLYYNRQHQQKAALLAMKKNNELTQLRARLEGEEKERKRIASELHDGIMVQFNAAQMNLSALYEKTDFTDKEELLQVLELLDEATRELRKSAHNLLPDTLLKQGLPAAAHFFCKTVERNSGLKLNFQLIGSMPVITATFELMIYRIIQELVQNVIKHARATQLLLQINCQPDLISVLVEDNGTGWNTQIESLQAGSGIQSIISRIDSLNGVIHFSNNVSAGTSVYIELETKHLQLSQTQAYA